MALIVTFTVAVVKYWDKTLHPYQISCFLLFLVTAETLR